MRKSRLAVFALAALWLGGETAWASQGCPATAPRFEPKTAKRPAPEAVKFLGGARLTRPVAEPCLRRAASADA